MFSYDIGGLKVKDAVLAFNKLHKELDIKPSSTSYEKLFTYLYATRMRYLHVSVDFSSFWLPLRS